MGMTLLIVNWIMWFLELDSFAMLINGSHSGFFKALWGIKQGFPLSPFLFLLMEKGIIMILKEAQRRGDLKGIRLTSQLCISLLFVDNIKIFR